MFRLHRLFLALTVLLVILGSLGALAGPRAGSNNRPEVQREAVTAPGPLLFGGSGTGAKARVDTVLVLGGPDRWDGRFETPGGSPDWHGWTHRDMTVSETNHWNISTYFAENLNGNGPGNHAMWCGEDFPACSPADSAGGSGDSYLDPLVWKQTVSDPSQATLVAVGAWLNTDLVDAGWDFLYYEIRVGDTWERLATWTGTYDNVYYEQPYTLQPGEYAGESGNEIWLRWLVETDWGWSDADCLSPSHGACQIDDITVTVDGEVVTFDDFEPGSVVNWTQDIPQGAGDFSKLWVGLDDLDPCQQNSSWQVAFIDDGEVVPGTGGEPCITWCYGPGGWIVNNTGGLQNGVPQSFFVENYVISPPIDWPAGHDGARFDFDVYRHETLCSQCPGVFYAWHIRSTASEDPADLEFAPWEDRNFFFYGGPDYKRHEEPVSDLLVPGARWVQIALEVNEAGWIWGWHGADGTPAPYFDNVALRAWVPQGPQIIVDERSLFQDAFPENGVVDPMDPASNWCRVDMARDISNWDEPTTPGDSMVVEIEPLRHGAELTELPRLHWVLQCNTLFDAHRPAAPGPDGLLRGSVLADSVRNVNGDVVPGRWAFDLPDTDFFFPGDRLRYYVTASDDLGGDVGTAVWPPDTTGVADFTITSTYPAVGEIRALPSVDAQWQQPSILFWDNAEFDRFRTRWLRSLGELGFRDGIDYDLYTSRRPGSDVGQGLGARCTVDQLDAYTTLLMATGNTSGDLLTGPDDPSNDIALLGAWLDRGQKGVLLGGDDIVSYAWDSSVQQFLNRLGVTDVSSDLVNHTGASSDLRVAPVVGGDVLSEDTIWQAFAGCPDLARIDVLEPVGTAWSAANFTRASGVDLGYPAVVANIEEALTNRILILPLALERIRGDQLDESGSNPLVAPRTTLLQELLAWLGLTGPAAPTSVPAIERLQVAAHPNPFNPRTVIAFDLPRTGHVDLAVYDLQGQLVRRLVNEFRPSGHHEAVWNGRDAGGRAAASGVYFYRLVAGNEERLGKLTLLK